MWGLGRCIRQESVVELVENREYALGGGLRTGSVTTEPDGEGLRLKPQPDASTRSHADRVSVGDAIRLLRERAGLSARQLSQASGLSPAYVNKVESGQVDPSFRAFSRIARQLGMSSREIYLLVCSEAERTT